jgi:integrase/recombinase XerD
MLENYYVRPVTIDRIRGSWIAPAIEQYVSWLAQQRFTSRSVLHRVPILVSFGEFAKAHGASELGHLPAHVEPFVVVWVRERAGGRSRLSDWLHDRLTTGRRSVADAAVSAYQGRRTPPPY